MTEIFLNNRNWLLSGWCPSSWDVARSIELGFVLRPEIGPITASVPGSVQKSLFDHGHLPDWSKALDSRHCEWVENREWIYSLRVHPEWGPCPSSLLLRFEGLDGAGSLFANGELLGHFSNSFIPQEFDLLPFSKADSVLIEVLFRTPPRWLGQFGQTSRIRDLKPRFNYTWDWLPRLVQIGIFGSVKILVNAVNGNFQVHTDGDVVICGGSLQTVADLVLEEANGELVACRTIAPSELNSLLEWQIPGVKKWNPNGNGGQSLYKLTATYRNQNNESVGQRSWVIGFKDVNWTHCQDCPDGSDPWICNINGRSVFLKGVNWTPIRPNFADLSDEDYRTRIELYRDLGFNLFRVWGGGFLESEAFYRLCDEYGILVWQEFPLCSSGPDNEPPTDQEVIATYSRIAGSYIHRRKSHVSLLCWCGGNELQTSPDGSPGCGMPINANHPMIAELAAQVGAMDPGRRFLPTSSSGPRFLADQKDFGKGLHWDVHGPWLPETESYWQCDDALFRSELGAPGASPVDLLTEEQLFPVSSSNPFWQRFAIWLPDPVSAETHIYNETRDIEGFVSWSQKTQADALVLAVKSCMDRFPRCGGVIIWMGHDAFPCLCNTSIVSVLKSPPLTAPRRNRFFRRFRGRRDFPRRCVPG
jgi:beta-mannosidase